MKPKLDSKEIAQQAKGKWPSILQSLGVDKAFLGNRGGPCPMCQDGRDRYRFDDKDGRGTWFCSQCPKQSGDGFALLMGVNGWAFPKALEEVASQVGVATPIKIRSGPDPEVIKNEIRTIWKQGRPINEVPATALWWALRTGTLPKSTDLRGVPSLRCPGAGLFPAMVALVRGPDDKVVNMHRTFLTEEGMKAPIDDPRRVMPLPMPKGSAVRLADYVDVLGIAEGIETAHAATVLYDVPCWAAINSVLLEGWEPPAGVKVVVFSDNDANFAGQAAAYNLAKRLKTKHVEIDVRLPPTAGMDWNDVLLAKGDAVARIGRAAA